MEHLKGVVGPVIGLALLALIWLQHRRLTRHHRDDRD
jgi:hypothetical protein